MAEVCQKMGLAEQTLFRRKKKPGRLGVVELRRQRQLEEANPRLKRPLADLTLDKQRVQNVVLKES